MFDIEAKSHNVHFVNYVMEDPAQEFWVRLSADEHFDSISCQRSLLKEHLNLAVERNALCITAGDYFDAMQVRGDPRSSYDELRPEYKGGDYLDLILNDAARWHEPYAKQFGILAMGNHETSIERHNGTNLTQRFVHGLRQSGGNAFAGGYTGYIFFRFTVHKNVRSKIVLKYHHGMGGGAAPVTRGVIQSNRMAVMFPDADILVSGHNHESWLVPIQQEKINSHGKIDARPQWHVRVPSYKDSWGKRGKGFDVEKGSPKPVGCVWLRFFMAAGQRGKIDFEATQTIR